MANAFKNAGAEIGTTDTILYTCPAGKTAVVHALFITNVDGTDPSMVDIKVTIDGGTTYRHIGKTIPVPQDTTFTLDKPINLEAGDKLALKASDAAFIEAFASVMEIS